METSEIAALDYQRGRTPGGKTYFALDLEAAHFFAPNKDEQPETIAMFLNKVYATAQRIPKPATR